MTPLKAIRQHCLLCMNGQRNLVRECHQTDCPAHPFRMGTKPYQGASPLKVIRALCLECQGGSVKEVRECDPNLLNGWVCPLHEFRFGKTGRKLSKKELAQRQNAIKNAQTKASFVSNLRVSSGSYV